MFKLFSAQSFKKEEEDIVVLLMTETSGRHSKHNFNNTLKIINTNNFNSISNNINDMCINM